MKYWNWWGCFVVDVLVSGRGYCVPVSSLVLGVWSSCTCYHRPTGADEAKPITHLVSREFDAKSRWITISLEVLRVPRENHSKKSHSSQSTTNLSVTSLPPPAPTSRLLPNASQDSTPKVWSKEVAVLPYCCCWFPITSGRQVYRKVGYLQPNPRQRGCQRNSTEDGSSTVLAGCGCTTVSNSRSVVGQCWTCSNISTTV